MSGYSKNQFDGDQSARTMEAGASAAHKNIDLNEGIHEESQIRSEPVGAKTSGAGTSMFSSEGSIGKQFTTQGAIGGTAQKLGGPFDAQGAIGKQFTDKGSIGGTVQEHLGKGESNSIRK
ncbi:hypothetical protein BFW01_g9739 [Lasiodiplodia theobromae]|uniref:uncharacterized protein n=1 Tax=Lasiodiplodia theobromae TaxID=45133 RepID=UPI0015C3DFEF|nr:uncharacterized protein LTHEOB_2549 [Lasiodiplodia theobromae]KAF4535557.1 hypothetical protein LTHEOB_2549 [Lasiodiplodia theobromae]KAF9638842.1 hypothetical protein BFW01_g9739 [Lasiodiplodia theobromae]